MGLVYGTIPTDNEALHDLRDGVAELNKNIVKLDQSTGRANRWMIVLTAVIVVLTIVLVLQGLKLLNVA